MMQFSKPVYGGRWRAAAGIAVAGGALLCLATAGPVLAGTQRSGSHAAANPNPTSVDQTFAGLKGVNPTPASPKSVNPTSVSSTSASSKSASTKSTKPRSSPKGVNPTSASSTSVGSTSAGSKSASSKGASPKSGKPKSAEPAPGKRRAPSAPPIAWADYYVVRTDDATHRPLIYELTVTWLNAEDLGLDVFQLGEHGIVPPGASVIEPGGTVVLPASGSSPAALAGGASASPPAAPAPGGWAYRYTIKTSGPGSNEVQYELAIEAQDGGDLSLDMLQLDGGGSKQVPSGVIEPSWVLVLPADGGAPVGPVGPLAAATTASGATGPSSGQRTRRVPRAATTRSAGQAWVASATGIAVIIALLTMWLLRRRGGRRSARRACRLSSRTVTALWLSPRRSGRGSARRTGVPSLPTPANNSDRGAGGTVPAPPLSVSGLDNACLPDGANEPESESMRPQLVAAAGPGADELAVAEGFSGRDSTAGLVPDLSPMASRMLTARRRDGTVDETADVPVQRLQVFSGDDQIDVVLAEMPRVGEHGGPDAGLTGSPPHLAWTLLPYDIPGNGVAFACMGAGDEGCLFLDLGAAPGVIALGGDRAAAARLAESIVHQLSMPGDARHRVDVIVVGDAVPEPLPARVTRVTALSDLGPAGSGNATRVIFCEARSNEEALALARHIVSAQHNAIPVLLGDLPGAPWSVTAQPFLFPDQLLAS